MGFVLLQSCAYSNGHVITYLTFESFKLERFFFGTFNKDVIKCGVWILAFPWMSIPLRYCNILKNRSNLIVIKLGEFDAIACVFCSRRNYDCIAIKVLFILHFRRRLWLYH